MTGKPLWILLAALSLGLAGAGAVLGSRNPEEVDATSPEESVIQVRTVRVETGPAVEIAPPVQATGTLRADRRVRLAFPVPGVVHRVDRDAGDTVKAGDVLARLDPVPYRAELDRAKARLSYMQSNLERTRLLYETQAVSLEKLDAVLSELRSAQAAVDLARWRLEKTALDAPFSGTVLSRGIELGQVLDTAAGAFVLLAVDTLKVEVGISARDLAAIHPGLHVIVTSNDRPDLILSGWVDHVPVSSDPRSGSVPILVKLANPGRTVLPGMVVSCSFTGESAAEATDELRVPVSAVRVTQSGPAVLRLVGGQVEETPVDLGPVRGETIVITQGLTAGDVIVDEAPDRLRDGDPVRPVS